MLKKFTLSLFLGLGLLSARAQFSNVPITPASFNADIIADGTAGTTPAATTTTGADSATPPYVFVSATFGFGTTTCATAATAWPSSLNITSTNTTTNTGITYTLQSPGTGTGTNNNALVLPYNTSGTLTLVTPISAAKLYIVAMGGSGATNYTAVVNFSDATSQTITTGIQAPDWCGGAATYRLTAQSYYRITRTATTCNGATCQYLYELPINIDPSNYYKTITSVTFTNTTNGSSKLDIFAMGAQAPCILPTAQPTALTFTAGLTQVNGSFTAAAGTPSGYLVVQYPHNAATTNPASGTTYTIGQTLGLGTVVGVGSSTTFTGTGLMPGTQYDYYIYAYNSGATCGGPVYLTTTPLTGVATTTSCGGTMTGTVPIGPGLPNTPAGGFTSLTNALAYINTNGLAGNTTLALQSGYVGTSANETFPITFPNNPCINASKTLTIRPATGVTGLTITNTSDAAPVIDFNGATNVTINGINYGLTIANTSVAATANTSTIRFINDAKNNVITNCNILGSALVPLGTNGGTIYFATGVTNGNDSITIANNRIGANSTTALPSKGIYAQGSTTNATLANSSINITGNEISDYFLTGGSAGVYVLTGNTQWNISNNKIFQSATRTFTASGTMNGIYFSNTTSGAGIQITGNTIGFANSAATGTLTLTGTVAGAFQGIYLNMNSADTNTCNINNNIISNIALTSSSGTFYGIQNASSAGSNKININNNQIQNIATTTTTGTLHGIAWTSAAQMNILGNTVNNISRTGTGTTYGIYSGSSSVNENVSNNIISNLIATSTGASTLYGIRQNTAAGTKNFKNNQIFSFSGTAGTTMYGMHIGYGTTIDISGNIVRDLVSTGGTSGAIYGINTGTVGTTFNVYNNKLYNLSMSGTTTSIVYGIYNSTSTINAYNNIIGDLASTAYTSTTAPYIGVSGIFINSGTANLYNNTVNLGSTTSSGTNFSAVGIYTSTTPTVLLQNNLIVNNAIPKGSGKAVAYQRSSTALTSYATTSNNNSFYAGTPGANNVIFWDGTNSYQTLAAYQTAMATRDQFSVSANPTFVSTSGANPGYLHITAGIATPLESGGINLTSLFNTDYDGNARPGPAGSVNGGALSFDIGADEFDGIKSFTCTTPAPGNTISSNTAICLGTNTTLSLQNATAGTGVSYQWQASANGIDYVDSAGATNATYTFTPTGAGTYYRCKVKCLTGPDSTYSTPIQLSFTNNILTSTPGTRCGAGVVNLAATANTGATINWYTAPAGGTPIGTGAAFTTPSISSTTNYYVAATSNSAGVVRIGSGTTSMGTTSYPNPLSAFYGGTKHQMLFLASELNNQGLVAGNITSISFDVTAFSAAGICNDFTIRMGTTTNTALTGFVTGTTPVYNSTYTPSATGVVTFTLTAPYNWNGTDNLILETVHNAGNGGNGSGTTVAYTTTPFNSVYARSIDNITPAGVASFDATTSTAGVTTTSANRPNVVFGGTTICSSPRVPVTATVNTAPTFTISDDKTACNNGVTPLTVVSPATNFNQVSWSPVSNLYTNAAATVPYTAGANASTVYFKSNTAGLSTIIATANNTATLCGGTDTVKVQTLPAAITALASPGVLCESGTSVINYSPAITQTGFTQQWGGSSDNINFTDIGGATGTSYTTPTLTNTRYFRVTVKNSDGATCMTSSDTVTVLHPQITQTVPAERCGPGVLTLTATAIDGVAKWFAAASGGTALATGNSFTTPNLTNTTTYYVSAVSGKNDTITVGTGTTTSSGYPNPYNKVWGGNRHQYLITAQELTTAGLTAGPIQGLALDIVALSTTGTAAQRTMNDLTIKLGTTTNTTMAGGFVATTSLQPVYNNAGYLPTATGWNYLNFSSTYQWDGISNLIVEFTSNSGNSGGGGAHTIRMSSTTYPATFARWADNVTPATAAEFMVTTTTSGSSNSYSTRANMRFYANTLCEGTRTPVVATIKTVPTAGLTPNGNINLCEGETQTLTASGTGTYTWLRNNTLISGQTSGTLAVTQTDPYKVIVTGSNGCADTSVSANITVVAKPIVNLGNDTAVCANETLQLNAGNTGATYTWSNSSTTQTIDVTTPGQYAVTVTNNFNCSTRDTINVTHLAFPVVSLGADTAICPSQPLTLDAQNPGAAYLWNNGTTGQTLVVNQVGAYSVVVTNGNNCRGADTINVSFVPAVINEGFDFEPLFNIQPGRVRFTPIDIIPGYTYTWSFGDGATSNQTIPEHDYTASGNYIVQLNASDGCTDSLASLEINVDLFTTAVTRVNKADLSVKIYPNPTSNILNVVLESDNTFINKLSIFNLIGQNVTTIVPTNKNTKQQTVYLDNLSSGAYLIKIETDKGTVNRKFEFIK
ncbi:MAG: T9SS type A sorting domain-containing protein [Taibaiella sp.]|nr:T9SS type A sorting domain-containing protein [Taibaiella sp.]